MIELRQIGWAALRAALLAVVMLPPGVATAVPPPNDNYLSSSSINALDGSLPREYTDQLDTTEAGTQADTFNPNRDGLPFGGGRPEPLACPGGPGFGKTVWYDFVPPVAGAVEIVAEGFDAVVGVYRWNAADSRLGQRAVCQNASSGPAETVLMQPEIRARQPYTIQVGGVGAIGGPLGFHFRFFPDRDADSILDDQPDKCPNLAGIGAFGGCPPLVRGSARVSFDNTGGGVRITRLIVDRVGERGRVEVRCQRCGRPVIRTARRAGTLRMSGFEGRLVRAGDRIEVRITQRRHGAGRYRFGAMGKIMTWPVRARGLGPLTQRCTEPSARKPVKCP